MLRCVGTGVVVRGGQLRPGGRRRGPEPGEGFDLPGIGGGALEKEIAADALGQGGLHGQGAEEGLIVH